MRVSPYYYKPSKVKGCIYMQIWKKENGKDEYVLSLGLAEKCFENIQKAQKLVNEINQTN